MSSVAKLYVSFNYSINKLPFTSDLLLFSWQTEIIQSLSVPSLY